MPFKAGVFVLCVAALAGCASAPPKPAPMPEPPAPALQMPAPEPETPPPPAELEVSPLAAEITVLPQREADLWMRIRSGFALNELDSPLVREHEAWYASRPDYVRRMSERSELYLFHIVEEVERRRLPSEIALLPMIESAFNPRAYSRSKAAGIWQFIPSTGKHFGLDQNWWYDGRRDVLTATNAALDYLEKLHKMFGSWDLALAAYNCGEGTMARAIAANQAKGLPTDYQSLNLPMESRHYVPKLMAVKHIIADPEAFGLQLNDVPNKPFFTTVEISKHIDVALAARFASMTVEELVALNPAFNKPMITVNDSERMLLPSAKVDVFRANMHRYGNQQLHTWQAYRAKKGERIDKIAGKFGMTVAQLRNLNTVAEKRGKLTGAQLLLVPLHPSKPLPTEAQIAAAQLAATQLAATQIAATQIATPQIDTAQLAPAQIATTQAEPVLPMTSAPVLPQTYVVQKGDTLFALAKRFGTSVDLLTADNQLADGSVKIGEVIAIPAALPAPDRVAGSAVYAANDTSEEKAIPASGPASDSVSDPAPDTVPAQANVRKDAVKTAQPAPAAKPSFYTVKRGDTLTGIARLFQVAVADLRRWNNFSAASKLLPGVRLRVLPALR